MGDRGIENSSSYSAQHSKAENRLFIAWHEHGISQMISINLAVTEVNNYDGIEEASFVQCCKWRKDTQISGILSVSRHMQEYLIHLEDIFERWFFLSWVHQAFKWMILEHVWIQVLGPNQCYETETNAIADKSCMRETE